MGEAGRVGVSWKGGTIHHEVSFNFFEVDVFEVSASILKISTFIVHKGKTTSVLVEDLVVENGC